MADAEKTVAEQAARLRDLSCKAQLDLFEMPVTVVAEYPDMLEEYNQMREQLDEVSYDYR